MKGKQAVVCPNCGALNRPRWQFCARCNESLEGALPEEQGRPTSGAPGGAERPSTLPANAVLVASVLALVVIGTAAWRFAGSAARPEGPSPEVFKMAPAPSELPSAPPPTGAGVSDFEAGRRLLSAGDLQGAVKRLEAAIAADPENAEFRSIYGYALWRSGDREGALSAHAAAARLDPRLQLRYARALDVAGQGAEAARVYQDILARSPGATAVHEDLGRLLFRTGDYRGAASHLQQAVQRRPDDPVLAQELGYSLDRSGQAGQATTVYREVLKREPRATVTRGLLAESLAEQGKNEEALAVLQEGLKASPPTPLLQRQLGSVLERSGRPADAAAAYRAYARLAPNAPDARDIADRAARLERTGGKP